MRIWLRYFVTARAVSILGDRVADVVLPLAILAAGGSPLIAGLVGAAVQLPQVLVALHVGAAVDRRERRGLMVAADLLRAITFTAMGAEIVFGGAKPVPLIVLALVTGVGDAVFNAAAGSHLPNIVGDRDLMRANGLVEASDAAATLTGPAVGGWVLQLFGALTAFLANAVSFVVSALLLSRLPKTRPQPEDEDASVFAGLRLVLRDRRQSVLLSGACYMHLLAAAAFLPLLVRARTVLGLSPGVIGLIVSAAGIGGLISSLLLTRIVDTRRWPLLLAGVLGINAVAVGVLAFLDAPVWLAVTVLVLDGASALSFILVATTRQRITPDGVRGRVFAASTAVTATIRLIAMAGVGALIDAVGPGPVLVGLAVLAVPFLIVLISFGSAIVSPEPEPQLADGS